MKFYLMWANHDANNLWDKLFFTMPSRMPVNRGLLSQPTETLQQALGNLRIDFIVLHHQDMIALEGHRLLPLLRLPFLSQPKPDGEAVQDPGRDCPRKGQGKAWGTWRIGKRQAKRFRPEASGRIFLQGALRAPACGRAS